MRKTAAVSSAASILSRPPLVQPLPALGDLLRRYRKAAELSQAELAERANLSIRSVSDLENGIQQSPRRTTVKALISALDLEPGQRDLFEAAVAQGNAPLVQQRSPLAVAEQHPLAGRSYELSLIDHHLRHQGPPLVVFAGEPGMGKSRMLDEAAERAEDLGWSVLRGGCQRREGQEPYAPIVDALAAFLNQQTARALRELLRGCAWLARMLPELADAPIDPLPAWFLSPEQERRLMFQAASKFLHNVAGTAGTLLLLDDLQWSSPDALDLLTTLIRSSSDIPLRVIGAYRHTELRADDPLATLLADLAHAQLAAHHQLPPLSSGETAQLLDSTLASGRRLPAETRDRLIERAGGVPFYVLSIARALPTSASEDEWTRAMTSALDDGSSGIGKESAGHIPWSIAQSVRQRVAALPELAQHSLEVAAVIGRSIPVVLISSILGQPESDLLDALRSACRGRLLDDDGSLAYRFTHDLIREVVEADLGPVHRAYLHRRVAETLEASSISTAPETLAYHHTQAHNPTRAADWWEKAGDQASAGYANATALGYYTSASEQCRRAASAGNVSLHLLADILSRLHEKMGDLRLLTADYVQAEQDFALARAQTVDPDWRINLWRKEGITWVRRANFARALAVFDAAVVTAPSVLTPLTRAALELSRGDVYYQQSDYTLAQHAAHTAIALLNEGVSAGKTREAQAILARAEDLLGRVATVWGDHDAAEIHFRHSLARYEAISDDEGIATVTLQLGAMEMNRYNLDRADEWFARCRQIRQRMGDQHEIANLWKASGTVAYMRDDLESACSCYLRNLEINQQIGNQIETGWGWYSLAFVLVEQGNLPDAEIAYRKAEAILTPTSATGQIRCLTGLGSIAYLQGHLGTAMHYCRTARRRARQLNLPLYEATAAIWQARAAQQLDQKRLAFALLERARARLAITGDVIGTLYLRFTKADLLLEDRQTVRAEELVSDALRVASEKRARWAEGQALRVLGTCAHLNGDFETAECIIRQALEITTSIGRRLHVARLQIVLAHLLIDRAAERQSAERQNLDEARNLLAEVEAQFARSGIVGEQYLFVLTTHKRRLALAT